MATRSDHVAEEGAKGRALRSPQLDELRIYCAAVELGSVGRAAQRLHLSQPGASKRLKSLEALVGVPLLERSPRGVTMTAAGERFYAHARRISEDVEDLDGLIADLSGASTTVRLSISHTAAEFVMPKALVLMHHRTNAPVEVLTANSRVVKRMVRAGEADIGVAACGEGEHLEGIVVVPLLEDEIVVAVPLGHQWARRGSITPQELLATRIVQRDPAAHTRQVVEEALEAHGLGPLLAGSEVGSTQAAKDEAHELGLPTLLSSLAFSVADRLEVVPIEGLRFTRRFCVLHPQGALSAASQHLLEAFRESAGALAAKRPESGR
ncbi:MAG: LysR family transcriptional regulator [Acidobacteriota bacterium]|nr:LysR family transcriptional regulator [Acidobacteriota bacterium]